MNPGQDPLVTEVQGLRKSFGAGKTPKLDYGLGGLQELRLPSWQAV